MNDHKLKAIADEFARLGLIPEDFKDEFTEELVRELRRESRRFGNDVAGVVNGVIRAGQLKQYGSHGISA